MSPSTCMGRDEEWSTNNLKNKKGKRTTLDFDPPDEKRIDREDKLFLQRIQDDSESPNKPYN